MSSTTYKPFLGAVKVGDTATSAEGVTSSSLAVQYKDEEGALQTFVADQASLTKLIWGRAEHVTDEADINAWDGSQIAALVGWMEAVPPERYNDLCLLEINSAGTGPTNDASPRAKGHLMVFRQTVPVGGTVTSEICHMCDLDLAEEVDRPETTVENNRALYSRGMSGDYYVPLSKQSTDRKVPALPRRHPRTLYLVCKIKEPDTSAIITYQDGETTKTLDGEQMAPSDRDCSQQTELRKWSAINATPFTQGHQYVVGLLETINSKSEPLVATTPSDRNTEPMAKTGADSKTARYLRVFRHRVTFPTSSLTKTYIELNRTNPTLYPTIPALQHVCDLRLGEESDAEDTPRRSATSLWYVLSANSCIPDQEHQMKEYRVLSDSGEDLGYIRLQGIEGLVHSPNDGTLVARGAALSGFDGTGKRWVSDTDHHAVILRPTAARASSASAKASGARHHVEDVTEAPVDARNVEDLQVEVTEVQIVGAEVTSAKEVAAEALALEDPDWEHIDPESGSEDDWQHVDDANVSESSDEQS
ncbi:uncharacterized protein MKK02DRAFT_45282 [Dioszegia hungarica]|uniref:Uncharacterized protein n=1 Tax=Dioszegia hungarica TaxID=4972 RepID=A0AA38H9X0_9TREE|nr:uncharacterized protein MKK02DRAFT_45282 [Dioszegia hungarica]KAI9636577.1 hypothetical protein MKK02DRAFT_45282 [Dioszegia hungarica]